MSEDKTVYEAREEAPTAGGETVLVSVDALGVVLPVLHAEGGRHDCDPICDFHEAVAAVDEAYRAARAPETEAR